MEEIFEEIGQLTGPMLKRRLFVCLSEPAGPAEAEVPVLPEHLRYLIGLEQQGVLFAAGPFIEGGRPGQRAMYVVRADSAEAARAIVSEEPFHRRGMRTFTLHEWSLNEGRVTLNVDFSSQRGGLDGRPDS